MKKSDLIAVGEYLYGEGWKHKLSEILRVGERAIRRWLDGTNPVPEGVYGELIEMAADKQIRESMSVIAGMFENKQYPISVVDLIVYPDEKVSSIHYRSWSYETDLAIKQEMALMLSELGYPAQVVKK